MRKPAPVSSGRSADVFSQRLYEAISKLTGLSNVTVEMNAKLPGKTTTRAGQRLQHGADIFWVFELDGRKYRAVMETRGWARVIELDAVMRLKAVLDDLVEPSRAVILTLAGFRRDAFEFATAHGIAPCILRPLSQSGSGRGADSSFFTLRGYVPKVDTLALQLDKEWMRTQTLLPSGEGVKPLSNRDGWALLYSEEGKAIASMEQLLSALLPREAKAVSKVPVRKTFGKPTYLHTDKAEFPRLKLSGVEAMVSVGEHESRHDVSQILTRLVRAITGNEEYAVDANLSLEKVSLAATE